VVDVAEQKRQTLTDEDLISVLNKNGFNEIGDVDLCVLEPNGTFFVKGRTPSSDDVERGELMAMISELRDEVRALRGEMQARG
jgi:uncharacterized membrane protein YcaP (DUF421 family)